MMKVLKNKNFFLLFQGAFVSEIGNMMYNMAMGFFILDITGSPVSFSIFMGMAILVRVLMSPLAGVMTDRWNRIRIIYITDFIRAIVFIGLAYVIFQGIAGDSVIFWIYGATVLSSISAAFFFPAVGSSIPDIVGEANLQAAQGLQGFLMQIPGLIGLAFGAALYDLVSIEVIVLINGISFGISGLSEMFIRTPYKKEFVVLDKSERKPIMQDYVISLKYIKENGLLNMILFFLVLNFSVVPIVSIAPPVLFRELLSRANTFEYAGTGMAFGIAAMAGALIVGGMKIKSYRKTIQRGFVGLGILFAMNALIFHLVVTGQMNYWVFYGIYLGLIVLMALNMSFVNIPVNVGITLSIEPEMRGRVFSTIGALSQLGIPFAMIIGGFVLEYYSISLLGLLCVIMMLVPTLGFIVNKKVRVLLNSLDEKRAVIDLEEENRLEQIKIIKEQEAAEVY